MIAFTLPLPWPCSLPCTFFKTFLFACFPSSLFLSRWRIKRERLSFAADILDSESKQTPRQTETSFAVLLLHYATRGNVVLVKTKKSEFARVEARPRSSSEKRNYYTASIMTDMKEKILSKTESQTAPKNQREFSIISSHFLKSQNEPIPQPIRR